MSDRIDHTSDTRPEEPDAKRAWIPMELRLVGDVSEVVRGGGGKLSPPTFDSGDSRKPSGLEP